MTGLISTFVGGALVGFAGSLHCACMCGGIASGALLCPHDDKRPGYQWLFSIQAGRIGSYAILGALAASAAGFAVDVAAGAVGMRILQWASAATLMFIGLSLAGLLPALPATAAFSSSGFAIAQRFGFSAASPALLGMVWGLTPCPLVYAALFSASLTGSAISGGAMMLGFGLGTLPGVLGAALGLSSVTAWRKDRTARLVMGVAVAGFGGFVAGFSPHISTIFCLAR